MNEPDATTLPRDRDGNGDGSGVSTEQYLIEYPTAGPDLAALTAAAHACQVDPAELDEWSGIQLCAAAQFCRLDFVTASEHGAVWKYTVGLSRDGFRRHFPAWAVINPVPPGDALPDSADTGLDLWERLRGAAPDATGELSSEEFVRRARDEWV